MEVRAIYELNYYDGPTAILALVEVPLGAGSMGVWYYGVWGESEGKSLGEDEDGARTFDFWRLPPRANPTDTTVEDGEGNNFTTPDFKLKEWEINWTDYEGSGGIDPQGRGERYEAWAQKLRDKYQDK